MTASARDLMLILGSIAVILGCGFGAGSLMTRQRVAETRDAPPTVPLAELEAETLSALRRSLELTPAQEQAIAGDLAGFHEDVLETRERAMLEYHAHLLDLHDRLMPRFEAEQREVLRRNRERLQETIERRFPEPPR